MRPSINELMKQVNCTMWPQEWSEFYNFVMDDFEKNGCELTNPEYYHHLHNEYGVLIKYLDLYISAALKLRNNKPLTAFLALLVYALKDRKNALDYANRLILPTNPGDDEQLEYRLLPALAMCSLVPYCYEKLKALHLPDDVILKVLRDPEKGIDEYRKRNNGAYGYHLLHWYQLDIDAVLFNIGSLSIEINKAFSTDATVFQNTSGEIVALADGINLHNSGHILGSKYYEDTEGSWVAELTETETQWVGFPYSADGTVKNKKIILFKKEWKKVLKKGDPVIALHIPAKSDFSKESLNKTFVRIKEFMSKYFPDYRYNAFTCHSWLLDPQLKSLLGENSNIVQFGNRFTRFVTKSPGTDVHYFVFMKMFGDTDISGYEPKTTLEKKLIEHIEQGKTIYELQGCILTE